MSAVPAIALDYDGEAFVPVHPRLADRHFVIGQRYMMAPYESRSQASHNHEFAWLAEAWRNLPEVLAGEIPTPEHLRKRALIEAGFFDETKVDAGSQAAALRVAAFMRGIDDFAAVVTRGPVVARRVAKSQSRRSMDAREFQASKQAILEVVSAMIGVAPEDLVRNSGRAA